MAETEAERLRLYRIFLQVTVRKVSPLVIDLAAYAGASFDGVVSDFTPRGTWPNGDLDKGLMRNGSNGGSLASIEPRLGHTRTRIHKNGRRNVMRGGASSGVHVLFTVVADRIEAMASMSGCALQTIGEYASLVLPDALPETIAATLPGRGVDSLIGHPVLDGRGYLVEHVRRGFSDGDVVTFRTGSLPCELPWRDLLEAEMEAGR